MRNPALRKIVDPLIYPHVRALNDLGVSTEYSCAGEGKSVVYIDGKITTKTSHNDDSNNVFPYIITNNKLDRHCEIVLGLVSFHSPEIAYCQEDKMFIGNCLKQHCGCEQHALVCSHHRGFRLIDISSACYGRKRIGIDLNLEMFFMDNEKEQKENLPILRKLFFKHFKSILRTIQTTI